MEEKTTVKIGVVTVSDRASRGEYEDRSGPAIRQYLDEILTSPWEPIPRIVSDDLASLQATLTELCDEAGCSLVITSGGTGPAPRDITPEATEAVCDKMMPGFGELMRKVSLEKVPTAILSRQTAGIRGSTCGRFFASLRVAITALTVGGLGSGATVRSMIGFPATVRSMGVETTCR